MNSILLKVGGMTCQHCVKHVTEALQELPGVVAVSVDLVSGKATVEIEEAYFNMDEAAEAIADAGYDFLGQLEPLS
ncbi:MAG: heavy-metal-associated domain-containing protein [Eubacteriales bacterium]|nr:heavy-metal-associated domain-containing protein [Eubacteriales bacterium]